MENSRSNHRVRGSAACLAVVLAIIAFAFYSSIPGQVRALMGIVAFILTAVACSVNPSGIRWSFVARGVMLQVVLAAVILKLSVGGVRPGYIVFTWLAAGVTRFLEFTSVGAVFVFGEIADPQAMASVFPNGFVLAFAALPIIVFVSSVFAVLYHLGVIQIVVRLLAKLMMPLLGTSGAETLSAVANVFMGQTEAPIIVRPYVPRMTQSELLALMTGGLSTIAGSMFAVYVGLGADPVAMLTTSVMAAPCGLYLAKILLPETDIPVTLGDANVEVNSEHANVVDAAASGASNGMQLALNVAAMLIAFLAFIAMIDYLLALIRPGLSN